MNRPYATYSKEELVEMLKRQQLDSRQEEYIRDGGGLRAEIARSHERTRREIIKAIEVELEERLVEAGRRPICAAVAECVTVGSGKV